METVTIVCVSMAIYCVIWYVVTTILIYENLRRRGEKVNFILLRMFAPWYASRYKTITKTETGRVGTLFYQWVISINLTMVLVLTAILINWL